MKTTMEVVVEPSPDGTPTIMLLLNGKVRVPYFGDMTLDRVFSLMKEEKSVPLDIKPGSIEALVEVSVTRNLGGIKKRDVVRCVKVLPREGGMPIELDKEYTVAALIKNGREVVGYELNDNDLGRIQCMCQEVEFVRENAPIIQRKIPEKEEIVTCECGEQIVLIKKQGENNYSGNCVKCGKLNMKELQPA